MIEQQMGLLAWPFAAAATIFSLQRVVALFRGWRRTLAVARGRRRRCCCRSRPSASRCRSCRRCFRRRRLLATCAPPTVRRDWSPRVTTNRAWCSLPAPRAGKPMAPGAADFLLGGGCRFAVVEKGAGTRLCAAGGEHRAALHPGPPVRGLSTRPGGRVSLAIFGRPRCSGRNLTGRRPADRGLPDGAWRPI